jgi:hypothetical protein
MELLVNQFVGREVDVVASVVLVSVVSVGRTVHQFAALVVFLADRCEDHLDGTVAEFEAQLASQGGMADRCVVSQDVAVQLDSQAELVDLASQFAACEVLVVLQVLRVYQGGV